MANQLGLNNDYAEKMIDKLNVYLSDVQVYYMNVRGYHWNITGKQFFNLHAKFEELYDQLNEMADEIAERILMLGGTPVHAFSKYLKMATLKERENVTTTDGTMKAVLDDMQTLLKEERAIVKVAGDADDDGTVDLITGYIDEQEKMIWMFSAYLK